MSKLMDCNNMLKDNPKSKNPFRTADKVSPGWLNAGNDVFLNHLHCVLAHVKHAHCPEAVYALKIGALDIETGPWSGLAKKHSVLALVQSGKDGVDLSSQSLLVL